MRRTFLLASAAALLAAPAFAQPAPAQSPGPAGAAPTASPSAAAQSMRISTQDFVRRAQMSDRFEIGSSRLAQQQGHSEAVKNFAAEMVRDHTRTTQELMELTQRLGPAVMSSNGSGTAATSGSRAGASGGTGSASGGSARGNATSGMANNTQGSAGMTTAQGGTQAEGMDAEHQQLMQRLGQARGAEFDRLYMQAQVQGHQQAVDMFTAYSQTGDQAELKQWAAKTLPHLQQHLQRAQQVQRGL